MIKKEEGIMNMTTERSARYKDFTLKKVESKVKG